MKITSLQHPRVKHWNLLRKERSYREKKGRVLVAGEKIVRELPAIRTLIVAEDAPLLAEEKVIVTKAILKKITGLEEPDGWAAEVDLPPPSEIKDAGYILIADQISDPGNLGTLLRTALALNWGGIVATPGTVDPFNDKALRASQGAALYLPYTWQRPEEIASWIARRAIFVADLKGAPLFSKERFSPPLALILSGEAKGVSPWAKKLGGAVSIPMQNGIDSLNVAAAGAIFLYAMRPR